MVELVAILLIAFVLDLFLGDPRYECHPIRLIGQSILKGEQWLRTSGLHGRGAGCLLVLAIQALSLACFLFVDMLLHHVFSILGLLFDLFLCYSFLALGDLFGHIIPVIRAVEAGRLHEARGHLAMMVGRDVEALDDAGVCRGGVETLAENFVDGFLSPLFYCVAGGILGCVTGLSPLRTALCFMLVFKIASTMDSMVGYKRAPYKHLGWGAARLDDILNFVPARLSIMILFLGALVTRGHALDGFRVALRDRLMHDSPNAGHPESFVAGALHIRLGGPVKYPDGWHKKPWLGAEGKDPGPTQICSIVEIIRSSAWMAMGLSLVILALSPCF